MTLQQLYITLFLYFLVIQFPLVCSATIDIDTVIDDTIFAVVLACSIVLDSSIVINGSNYRKFIRRKRKQVQTILDELGPYQVRRSYRMYYDRF